MAGLLVVPPGPSVAHADDVSGDADSVSDVDSELAEINRALSSGDADLAAKTARQSAALSTASQPSLDAVRTMARLASAMRKAGDLEAAAEFFDIAIQHETLAATGLDPSRLTLPLHLAAISVYVKQQDDTRVLRSLAVVASASHDLTERQQAAVTDIAFQMGRTLLSGGHPKLASQAYHHAADLCTDQQRATATLGIAWASVVEGSKPVEAAQRLSDFVQQYPEHADAPQATLMCARCLRQAGKDEQADQICLDALDQWPDSSIGAQVAQSYVQHRATEVPDPLRRWLMVQTHDGNHVTWDAPATALALRIANHENRIEMATRLTRHLATVDESGQNVADLLNRSDPKNSELLATFLISPPTGIDVAAAPREAAARWAGRNQKWNLLSLAANSEAIHRLTAGRTPAVERLFAESLMQTGNTADAAAWWNHLVDVRQQDDFATLLRCAEAETAIGEDTELASERIAMARAASANDPLSIMLVDLLEAELSIRRSRFDEARSMLENVVRGIEVDARLRGRAQWLIGETHYLQHQFAAAIDAYRSVEGVDPSGTWVPASMIQAGKAFEQLGRTREAALCYGNLLGRFADSPYASAARQRMAAIDPGHHKHQNHPNAQSIRR
jgi:TolA-binding protein